MIEMNLGDTRLIISECMRQGLLRNQAAYVLATACWETARTMQPVEEAFWLSDSWRRANLRYYPWHGRGYVQLTWERNYHKASAELGIDLVTDPRVALEPENAVLVLVRGMADGWFTGKKLSDYVTLERSNFVGARRVVNGTDKAQTIAELAREYDAALKREGYGVEPDVPVINDRRDGRPPRTRPASTSTIKAVGTAALSAAGAALASFRELPPTTQAIVALCGTVLLVSLLWIFKERVRKFRDGDG